TARDGFGPARHGAGMALFQEPSKQPRSAARLGRHRSSASPPGGQRTPPAGRGAISLRGRQLTESPRMKGIETNGFVVLGEDVIKLVAVVGDVPQAVLGMGGSAIPRRDLGAALRTGQGRTEARR